MKNLACILVQTDDAITHPDTMLHHMNLTSLDQQTQGLKTNKYQSVNTQWLRNYLQLTFQAWANFQT